jgi:hypothetical protein
MIWLNFLYSVLHSLCSPAGGSKEPSGASTWTGGGAAVKPASKAPAASKPPDQVHETRETHKKEENREVTNAGSTVLLRKNSMSMSSG